jgi:predicted nucleic acid-binding protein
LESRIKTLRSSANYVLDSYTVLAYFQKEKGSHTIKELLKKAAQNQCNIYFCIINLGEAIYITEREQGLQAAQMALSLIKELPIEVVVIANEEITLEAAHIKANFPIAYADCFAAAVAKKFQGLLVTGDPEFKLLQNYIDIMWI